MLIVVSVAVAGIILLYFISPLFTPKPLKLKGAHVMVSGVHLMISLVRSGHRSCSFVFLGSPHCSHHKVNLPCGDTDLHSHHKTPPPPPPWSWSERMWHTNPLNFAFTSLAQREGVFQNTSPKNTPLSQGRDVMPCPQSCCKSTGWRSNSPVFLSGNLWMRQAGLSGSKKTTTWQRVLCCQVVRLQNGSLQHPQGWLQLAW